MSTRVWFGLVLASALLGGCKKVDTCSGFSACTGGPGGGGGTAGTGGDGGNTSTTGGGGSGGTTTSGGSGGGGAVCGGIAGLQCAADDYCDYPDGMCGGDDGTGKCKPRPLGCGDVYAPVCTCSGTVASSECDAFSAGLDSSILGGCTAPEGMFACGASFCQDSTQYCKRTVSDVGSIPDSYQCQEVPQGCGATVSCDCLAAEACGSMCQESDGGFTLTCPGG